MTSAASPVPPAFLTVEVLQDRWRSLTPQEKQLATQLLDSAGKKIRDEYRAAFGSEIADNDPNAETASLEMVRTAISTGAYAGHLSYARTEGPRMKSGSLSVPGGALELTDYQRSNLGLPVGSLAQSLFDDCSDERF